MHCAADTTPSVIFTATKPPTHHYTTLQTYNPSHLPVSPVVASYRTAPGMPPKSPGSCPLPHCPESQVVRLVRMSALERASRCLALTAGGQASALARTSPRHGFSTAEARYHFRVVRRVAPKSSCRVHGVASDAISCKRGPFRSCSLSVSKYLIFL